MKTDKKIYKVVYGKSFYLICLQPREKVVVRKKLNPKR